MSILFANIEEITKEYPVPSSSRVSYTIEVNAQSESSIIKESYAVDEPKHQVCDIYPKYTVS